MRRLLNMAVSGAGLLVLAPFVALMTVVARFDTKGTGIFAQTRVGRHRKPFTCYKLRTMRSDAPELAASHTMSASFVTPFGSFLRKTKLDEVPQLWNVFVGDMDIIGPRPCLEVQIELIEEREKRGVFEIRPGITGHAQILGVDMSDPVRLATLDAEYIRKRSLSLDLRILLKTVTGSGSGDRVAVSRK